MDFTEEALRKYEVEWLPRSAGYDPAWVHRNEMGPNALWLAEAISQITQIKPGMLVLDMGCRTAMSSKFLEKEFFDALEKIGRY